jgi:hypothetical protein
MPSTEMARKWVLRPVTIRQPNPQEFYRGSADFETPEMRVQQAYAVISRHHGQIVRQASLEDYAFGHLLLAPPPYPEEFHRYQPDVLETLARSADNPFMSMFPAKRYGKFQLRLAAVVKDLTNLQEAAECEGSVFRKQVEDFFQETNQEVGGIINKEAEF